MNAGSLSSKIGEDGFHASINGQFLIDVMQVGFDCLNGNAELVSDFLVASSGGRAS